jgi:hypothetical protein
MKAQYVINALDKAGIEIEMSLTTTGPVTSHRVKIDNISFWIKTRQGEIVSLEKRTGYTDADCDQVVEKIRTCKAFVSAILSARTTITPETEGDWMSQQGGCCVCKDTAVLVDKLDNVFCEKCAEQDQEDSPENWDNSEVEFEKNAVDLEVQVKQAATGLVTAAVEYKPLDKKTAHQAHAGTSFSPEKRGDREIESHKNTFEELAQVLGDFFEQKHADKLHELWTAYLRSHAAVMSTMITGPANFPTDRNRKRSGWADNKRNAMHEYFDNLKKWKAKADKRKYIADGGGELVVAKAEPTFNLTTDKGAGMIDKYKDMVNAASWLFGTDSPAYHIAELSASVAYTGCILLEAPRVYKDYLRAKMVFKGAGYPEYAGAVDNLYRGMRNEPNNESTGLDSGVSTTL